MTKSKNDYLKEWKIKNPDKCKIYREKQRQKANIKKKERYKNDLQFRENILEKGKLRYRNNPLKKLIAGAKRRSKLNNLPFNLTEDDLVIPEFCPVFGIALEISDNKPSDFSPSLDRIIPELGYVKDNVVVISNLANRMKSNATQDQLITFAKWILNEQLKRENPTRFVTPDNP